MKISNLASACGIAIFAAAPAFAEQAPTPAGPGPWGYHPMMWDGSWGWHPGFMIFGPFLMLLTLIGTVVLVVWLLRGVGHAGFPHWHGAHWHGPGLCPQCGRGPTRQALDILEERFAKGEIDKGEFEEKRKLLGR